MKICHILIFVSVVSENLKYNSDIKESRPVRLVPMVTLKIRLLHVAAYLCSEMYHFGCCSHFATYSIKDF